MAFGNCCATDVYCGYGSSSCRRATVADESGPLRMMPENGFGTSSFNCSPSTDTADRARSAERPRPLEIRALVPHVGEIGSEPVADRAARKRSTAACSRRGCCASCCPGWPTFDSGLRLPVGRLKPCGNGSLRCWRRQPVETRDPRRARVETDRSAGGHDHRPVEDAVAAARDRSSLDLIREPGARREVVPIGRELIARVAVCSDESSAPRSGRPVCAASGLSASRSNHVSRSKRSVCPCRRRSGARG